MPYSGIDDVPARVKKFWKNIGASESTKRQWVHVFNSCKKAGNSDGRCFRQANGVVSKRTNEFIANAIPQKFEMAKANTIYGDVWQFPVTMTREGVQNGFFKDFEELKASAYTGNVPIVYGHPHNEDGYLTSATRIYEFLGFTSDAHVDEEDLSLKATGNIFDTPDNQLLIDSIRNGENRDVSVGFFTDEFQADGEYNGVKYKGVEINIAFDHLAILPNGHGACSQSDRCGIGVNMTEPDKEVKTEAEHGPSEKAMAPGFSALQECAQNHLRQIAWDAPPEQIMVHMRMAMECFGQHMMMGPAHEEMNMTKIDAEKVQEATKADEPHKTDEQVKSEKTGPTIEQKKEIVYKVLKEMGFDEADLEGIDYDAIYYFVDCNTCSGAEDVSDYAVWHEDLKENVTYTFSPAWGSINKSDLPRDAFMVTGDPEKKSTWKLPYKYQGKVHCGAIRAIRAVLAGARGGVNLSSEDRGKARRLADRHWAACQRIKERGDSKIILISDFKYQESVEIPEEPKNEESKDLNISPPINITQSTGNTMTEETAPPEDKKASPTEAELIAAQGAKITELVAANDKLTKAVESLSQEIELRKVAEEKARKDAFETEKRAVYEMNFKYRIYPDDAIAHADEKSLKLMKGSLEAINARKEDLRGVVSLHNVGPVPQGLAPLTIGDLSKKVQTPKVK